MSNVAKKLKHNPLIEMEQTEKFYLTNSHYVEQALKFIDLIHHNNTGFFCLCKRDGKEFSTRFMYKQPNFNTMMNYLHLEDLYLSVNSFYIPLRQGKAVRQINALFIDLDYYKIPKYKNKTVKEMINIMRNDGMFTDLEPSFFCDSGNGMYIFYLIENVPKQMINVWQQTENYLVNKFECYGADPVAKDVSRILKVAGSINSKTGRRAELILHQEPTRYNLINIKEKLIPNQYTKEEWIKLKELRKKKKKEYKKNTNKKIRYLFSLKSLNYNRALDIKKIIELREFNINGYRHLGLYLYGLFTMYYNEDIEKTREAIYMLNKSLTEPLSDIEIKHTANTILNEYNQLQRKSEDYRKLDIKPNLTKFLREQGCIIYSNQGIIKRLNITSDEMEQLKTLIDSNERLKRKKDNYQKNKEEINKIRRENYKKELNKQGKLSKQEQLQIIYGKIKSLLAEGLKQKDISVLLDIKPRTLKRYIKYMKENGLI